YSFAFSLVQLAESALLNRDVMRAITLLGPAETLISSSLRGGTPEMARFLTLSAEILASLGNVDAALDQLNKAAEIYKRLQIEEPLKAFRLSYIQLLRAAFGASGGHFDIALDAIRSHPLNAYREAIFQATEFPSLEAFLYGVADLFVTKG